MTDDHLGIRVDPALSDRLESVSDRYDMNKSSLARTILDNGLEIVEEQGIDAIIDAAEGKARSVEAD